MSDVLHEGSLRDPGARKVLATTRAGTLLDLFEATGQAKWSALAERAMKVAYALGPQDDAVKGSVGASMHFVSGLARRV